MRAFEKKFKDKAGLTWSQRGEAPKSGKYAFVEKSYEVESEDEGDDAATSKAPIPPPSPCTLEPPVQELMKLIFNQSFFNAAMEELNYDAKKLPLGQLSKATIARGFQTLKALSALIDDPSQTPPGVSHGAAVEELSNAFYSVIPHYFGRQRPPVISTQQLVKREIGTLESLSDMKDAALIMKLESVDMTIHPLTKQFNGLGMEEMTPLKHDSTEFLGLQDYLHKTRGPTHYGMKYDKVEEIFRIERQGEKDRFENSPHAKLQSKNRRLLWHGSRTTNSGGILSQGLRIAPPEAPVNGYMFDKGIYLADMSTKSANYCCAYASNNTALLLLCEAELGDPVLELLYSDSSAATVAKKKGMISTLGQGRTGPTKWKDAGDVHPSLKGIQIVSCVFLVGFIHDANFCSPTSPSNQVAPASRAAWSTTSTFATTLPKSVSGISSGSRQDRALMGSEFRRGILPLVEGSRSFPALTFEAFIALGPITPFVTSGTLVWSHTYIFVTYLAFLADRVILSQGWRVISSQKEIFTHWSWEMCTHGYSALTCSAQAYSAIGHGMDLERAILGCWLAWS